jgi:hypothetical protein
MTIAFECLLLRRDTILLSFLAANGVSIMAAPRLALPRRTLLVSGLGPALFFSAPPRE